MNTGMQSIFLLSRVRNCGYGICVAKTFAFLHGAASRMESTGISGKIQVSEATAQLLKDAGKGDWLQERKDMVKVRFANVYSSCSYSFHSGLRLTSACGTCYQAKGKGVLKVGHKIIMFARTQT